MADIEVYFKHPVSDRRVRAKVDDTMTAQEVIDDLIRDGFLQSSRNGYYLARKDMRNNEHILPGTSLRSAGVRADDVLRVDPISEAGSVVELRGR